MGKEESASGVVSDGVPKDGIVGRRGEVQAVAVVFFPNVVGDGVSFEAVRVGRLKVDAEADRLPGVVGDGVSLDQGWNDESSHIPHWKFVISRFWMVTLFTLLR